MKYRAVAPNKIIFDPYHERLVKEMQARDKLSRVDLRISIYVFRFNNNQ